LTEYKGIKGGKVRNYSEDPENPIVGQVWYNETLGNLRIRKTNIGSAWATAAPLNTARSSANQAGSGTQTAALVFGGLNPAIPGPTGATESYNGTSWTELNDMTTARRDLTGAGRLNTAALAFSGETPVSSQVTNTGDYDGKEVVQMYIRDNISSASRPVLELKGFEKIFLKKGESKIVEFEITPEKLKFFDRNMQEVVEPGKFTIYAGKNSADLQSVELTVID